MKKIVNGLSYDTTTAKNLCGVEVGQGRNGYAEILYRTPTGTWFVHIMAGKNTSYAKQRANKPGSSFERIRPLTTDQAHRWFKKNNPIEDPEKYFCK